MRAVSALVQYALKTGLVEECETLWAKNVILDALGAAAEPETEVADDAPLNRGAILCIFHNSAR